MILLASAVAAELALSGDRVATAIGSRVTVYSVPDGAVLVRIPLTAEGLEWQGNTLLIRLPQAVASWSPKDGLRISDRLPGPAAWGHDESRSHAGPDAWTMGPHQLVYAWESGPLASGRAAVLDPWTGTTHVLRDDRVPVLSADAGGFIDRDGLHAWDGSLRVALSPDPSETCRAVPGPRVLCVSPTEASVHWGPGGRPLAWSTQTVLAPPGSTIVDALPTLDLLVRRHAPDGRLVVVGSDGRVRATLGAGGTATLVDRGVALLDGDALAVYGVDGAERMRVPLSHGGIVVALPEPALLLRGGDGAWLVALDDGAPLAQLGDAPPLATVHRGEGGAVVSFEEESQAATFRRADGTRWVWTDSVATVPVREAGVEGRICDAALALVTVAGDLQAWGLDGARRWTIAAAALGSDRLNPVHVVACEGDRWLVEALARWSVVDASTGTVGASGPGRAAPAAFPGAVSDETSGVVTLTPLTGPPETFVLPHPWKTRAFAPATGQLPAGVIAAWHGRVGRFDGTGERWEVRVEPSSVTTHGGRVYLAWFALGQGARTVALDAATGELVWAALQDGTDGMEFLHP